jgi:glycosyltransferase involved in cell wall biosynthesis
MKCSFIVSAYDRPEALSGLLYSLRVQTEPDFHVLVTDNAPNFHNRLAVQRLNDYRFRYCETKMSNCYASANMGAEMASGDYLCFPSDDDYYVPRFLELMLQPGTELVYCDMLYDPRLKGVYAPVNVQPGLDIDKGGFLIKSQHFQPFPWERPDGLRLADHYLINDLVAAGLSHAKVPGVLWVHN